MLWLFSFVYWATISHRVFSEEDKKLLLVQTIFRHGDRAPRHLYPKDPNSKENWPEGLGKLTLLGKKQHYALGKFLRSKYQDFITTNPNEVLVNSSASHRCLTSAAAFMASFYAPEESWKVDDDLNWQPITIHYLPLYKDKYLSFRGTCPRATIELKRQLSSDTIQELLQKYQANFEEVSNYSGLNVFEGMNAMRLYDTLGIEKMHNLTTPEWAHLYWNELREAADVIFENLISSPIALRLRAGPLLQDIDQNLKKKINGDLPDLKVQVYSTHDVNVASVLLALNFTNMPRPPYCATLLFELFEMSDSSMALRILYMNSTNPLEGVGEPHVLELDGCSEFCPVENFTKKLQNWIPEDWEQECQFDALNNYETDHSDVFRVTPNN